jgi:type IVB pilus formation R64 PilN family outer membrane protein
MQKKTLQSNKVALLSLVTASLLSACAVSNKDVQDKVDDAQASIEQRQQQLATQRQIEPPLTRINGNYVAGAPVELGTNARLPSAFRDVVLRYAPANSIQTVAERITDRTGIPVDIHPDVLAYFNPALRTSAATPTLGAATSNPQQPSITIDMDFRGNLGDYLDVLCARYGMGWEYINGTINITRMVTRMFQVKASPGSTETSSKITKGSASSAGTTGSGAGGQTTGSFSSSSETSVNSSKISTTDSLQAAIKGMLTPALGKVTINEATGTIIVTDTRMVVDQVSKLVDYENIIMGRQVSLQVDVITLQIDDKSQFGFDANLVYKSLGNAWGANLNAASTLATTAASGLTYNILPGTNSNYNGSSLVLKALNSYGKVVRNESVTLNGRNRTPMPLAEFNSQGYLASTTPASGGATAAGTGVPGLTPGNVTSGLFLSALPTILDNNSVILRMSMDSSTLLSIDSISTGTGATLQQIQLPNTKGRKTDHEVTLRGGDALVLVNLSTDATSGNNNTGILSNSLNNSKTRSVELIVVTPRIQSSL